MSFAERLIASRVKSLTVFGDSITVGLNASTDGNRWANRLAAAAGIPVLRNAGVSGTVLQGGAMADGRPRPDNGMERYGRDVLGPQWSEALAILYGYNDARYVGSPLTLNAAAFQRDYEALLDAVLAAGIRREFIAIGSPPYPSDQGLMVGSPGFAGQSRAGFERYVRAVRDVAGAYGVYYAGVYEAMSDYSDGGLSSPDITHPNDRGHSVIAEAFLTAQVGG